MRKKETRPVLSDERAAAVAGGAPFNIDVERVTALYSYDDANWRVVARGGAVYVLKVQNPATCAVAFQTAVCARVAAAAGVPCPTVVAAGRAEPEGLEVRLFSFVPGRVLKDAVDGGAPLGVPQLLEVGRTVASVTAALQGFDHPQSRRDLLWDLRHAGDLRGFAHLLRSDAERVIFDRALAAYDALEWSALRAGVIWNDGNDGNILVAPGEAALRVVGVIDFGDAVWSHVACEVGITAAYMSLFRRGSKAEVLATWDAVRDGFEAVLPLDAAERAAVPTLATLRLLQSAMMARYAASLDPDNAYAAETEKPGWECLHLIYS
jgi:Ser/Thr protein kinase RdoA (MazF antagonist)